MSPCTNNAGALSLRCGILWSMEQEKLTPEQALQELLLSMTTMSDGSISIPYDDDGYLFPIKDVVNAFDSLGIVPPDIEEWRSRIKDDEVRWDAMRAQNVRLHGGKP